jgi:hypothetical protein
MRFIITQDGNVLAFDPETGVVSAPSKSEAEAEIGRRKEARRAA